VSTLSVTIKSIRVNVVMQNVVGPNFELTFSFFKEPGITFSKLITITLRMEDLIIKVINSGFRIISCQILSLGSSMGPRYVLRLLFTEKSQNGQ
jgi:hypothetical protein